MLAQIKLKVLINFYLIFQVLDLYVQVQKIFGSTYLYTIGLFELAIWGS